MHNCQNVCYNQHTLFEICSWSPKSSTSLDVLLTFSSPYEFKRLFCSFVCVALPSGDVEGKCTVCVVFVVSFFTILLIFLASCPSSNVLGSNIWFFFVYIKFQNFLSKVLNGFPHAFVVWLWTNYCLLVIALQVPYMWPTYCQNQDTSLFPFRNAQSTHTKVSLDTKGSPYIPLYIKWASQRPPFHLDSSATRLNIMDAL